MAILGIGSTEFKRIPGGWVFLAPNPWLFGPARGFLVNNTQKAEIAAIQMPNRLALILVVALPIAISFAVGMHFLSYLLPAEFFHGDLTTGQLCVLLGRGLIQGIGSVLLPLQVLRWLELRRLRPVLVGLQKAPKVESA
jgi:hypothetical protein